MSDKKDKKKLPNAGAELKAIRKVLGTTGTSMVHEIRRMKDQLAAQAALLVAAFEMDTKVRINLSACNDVLEGRALTGYKKPGIYDAMEIVPLDEFTQELLDNVRAVRDNLAHALKSHGVQADTPMESRTATGLISDTRDAMKRRNERIASLNNGVDELPASAPAEPGGPRTRA